MEIIEFEKRPGIEQHKKLADKFLNLERLFSELRKREIPVEIIASINKEIDLINSFTGTHKELLKQLRKTQKSLLKLIVKELNLVPKNHYRNLWLAVGMSAFGIPIGVVFGTSLGNMAFLGIGLPIGMAIGIAVGASMDKKAKANNLQLDIELEH